MIAPDGKTYLIPPEMVNESMLRGGVLAQRMSAPDGKQYWIPVDQVEQSLQHGGHFLHADGSAYEPGTEPAIVGHNAAGKPIWGDAPKPAGRGFLGSAGDALVGAAKGAAAIFDPRPNEYEREHGLTTIYDAALSPLERLAEPQVQAGERAIEEAKHGDPMKAAGLGLAAITPGVGPMAAGVGEKVGEQVGTGDYSGAAGTLLTNAALAEGPRIVKAAPGVLREAPGAIGNMARAARDYAAGVNARIQAPDKVINTPVGPGELTPLQRYRAAREMGANLDRAQATGASGPKVAKGLTEHSLPGKGPFEGSNAANVEALHRQANRLIGQAGVGEDGAPAPLANREEFGNVAKAKLQAHRARLADEPGQTAQAQELLNSLDKRDMTGEEYGADSQQALAKHHDSMYKHANESLTGALQRKGTLAGIGDVEETASKIYNDEQPYFDENPWALNAPGVKTAWNIVKALKPREAVEPEAVDTGVLDASGKPVTRAADAQEAAGPREMTPAMVAKARSDLWNLYQSPEIVGSRAEGWLKQLVASLDDALTSPDNERGLTPGEIQQFRAGTSLWKRMKSMYDDPQSPFFSILRSPEPKTIAGTLEKLKPAAARQFREAMADVNRRDLVGQQQRQLVGHLLDPSENGSFDLGGFAGRWEKMPKEQASELLGPKNVNLLNDLGKKTGAKTIYDTPGSHLPQIISAPDGLSASRVMFNENGTLRLTPEEIRQMEQADPTLLPQLRQQAVSRLLDPAANGFPDLRNFSSRWNHAQKEPLEGLLSEDHLKSLDDLASVAKTVNLPSNPSGTAVVLQPVHEASEIARGIGEAGAGFAAGHVLGPVGGIAGALAMPVAERVVAKRFTNPQATESIMEGPRPSAIETFKRARDAAGRVAAPAADALGGTTAPDLIGTGSAIAPRAPAAQPTPTEPERDRQLATPKNPAPTAPLTGVSTPPNGGQILDVNTSEPNEVHNEAEAAAEQMSPTSSGSEKPQASSVSVYWDPAHPETSAAPEGATHEVLHPETQKVIGHVVNGEYVPLNDANE